MTTYTFREIALFPSKSGKCAVCGKRAKRSTKIYQTVSPFNRDETGKVRTPEEIYQVVRAKTKAWREAPVVHAKCEEQP